MSIAYYVCIAGYRRAIEVHDLFRHGEDARLAGNEEEAVRRLAAEPTRPVKAAIVQGTIESVTSQGF
jgi:hypothetical protein